MVQHTDLAPESYRNVADSRWWTFEYCSIASLELFQGDALWPCAPLIKELWAHRGIQIIFRATSSPTRRDLNVLGSGAKADMEPFTTISDQPSTFSGLGDMSFAKELKAASFGLTIQVPNGQIEHGEEKEEGQEEVLARVSEWVSNNPRGWSFICAKDSKKRVFELELIVSKPK